jgi:predicted nuclease of restriction endonuclease-like (RecB) superfamily
LQAPLAKLKKHDVIKQGSPILQAPLAKLSWYHHITLLDRVKDREARLFYINKTVENGWSRNVMVHQIESGLHKRQGKLITNFKNTIASEQSELVQQLFKDPYKFDFISLSEEAKERDIENALIDKITKLLLELGQWFAFMGRQYKIILGKREVFIDLLFYHTRLKRYIIIDLKIDEFKPEYAGKMDFYLNVADDFLRHQGDNESIGLILCKTKDGLMAEYALKRSGKPIGIAEYRIPDKLPASIKRELPSIEEIESRLGEKIQEFEKPLKTLKQLKNRVTKRTLAIKKKKRNTKKK